MRKAEIHTVTRLCDLQLPCGKYTILGYIENQAMIHVQSMIGYLYGMECKGQIIARTCLMNKIVRGFVSQEVHDEWASKKAKELNKPWGIHHVQTGKESVHFISAERLLPLLLGGTPLAKPSDNIKLNSQARFKEGRDFAYLSDLVALCKRLASQFVDKSKHINASSHADTTDKPTTSMTLSQAVEAIQQFQEEIDRLDAELECLTVDIETTAAAYATLRERVESLNMKYSETNILRSKYHRALIAAAHIITTFGPSTLPAEWDPKLLE
jgi:hypothetical protein